MYAWRSSTVLPRLLLTWFLLVLGVAGISPIVHPRAMEMVCTTGGIQLVALDGDTEADGAGPRTLDCALCLAHIAPTTSLDAPIPTSQRVATTIAPSISAGFSSRTGAPLPARGPPLLA